MSWTDPLIISVAAGKPKNVIRIAFQLGPDVVIIYENTQGINYARRNCQLC
jgi:hypothetical protein